LSFHDLKSQGIQLCLTAVLCQNDAIYTVMKSSLSARRKTLVSQLYAVLRFHTNLREACIANVCSAAAATESL